MSILGQKKYTAIAFDLFNTLVSVTHSNPSIPTTHELLHIDRQLWHHALFNDSEKRLRGSITDPLEILRDIVLKINPSVDQSRLAEISQIRFEKFRDSFKKIETSVCEVLKSLKQKGYSIGLISNADTSEKYGWNDAPVAPYFDCVTFSCDCGYMKPEKEIYLHCLNELGVDPQETLFVGDGSCNELEGANQVGMDTVFTSQYLQNEYPQEIIQERIMQSTYHITHMNQLI